MRGSPSRTTNIADSASSVSPVHHAHSPLHHHCRSWQAEQQLAAFQQAFSRMVASVYVDLTKEEEEDNDDAT